MQLARHAVFISCKIEYLGKLLRETKFKYWGKINTNSEGKLCTDNTARCTQILREAIHKYCMRKIIHIYWEKLYINTEDNSTEIMGKTIHKYWGKTIHKC